MRFVLKREAGTIGLPDLLMTVVIADAAQNAMAVEIIRSRKASRRSSPLCFGTILWTGSPQRFPRIARLLHPPPLPLVKDGRLLRRNMRRELITEEELRSHLRQQGIAEFAQVQAAYMEGDGQISIIRRGSCEVISELGSVAAPAPRAGGGRDSRADELAQRRGLTSDLDEMWSYVRSKAHPRWFMARH